MQCGVRAQRAHTRATHILRKHTWPFTHNTLAGICAVTVSRGSAHMNMQPGGEAGKTKTKASHAE